MKKVVTKSGDFDKTVVYLYDGVAAGASAGRICETQNGSDVMVQQFIHGTQYIDELVMVRVKKKGDLYVHQDANWNVVALTDLGTHLVERYVYTPYGELIVEQETSFGDRDGDGDVDSTDKGTVGVTCTGTVTAECRILDFDGDGDYDAADAAQFDSLPQGIARHPGRAFTGVDQPFAHQGLLYDAEISQYQNRHRQYDPAKRRFLQRDPYGQLYGIERYRDLVISNAYMRKGGSQGRGDVIRQQDPGMNLYEYISTNPVMGLDPSGLIPIQDRACCPFGQRLCGDTCCFFFNACCNGNTCCPVGSRCCNGSSLCCGIGLKCCRFLGVFRPYCVLWITPCV